MFDPAEIDTHDTLAERRIHALYHRIADAERLAGLDADWRLNDPGFEADTERRSEVYAHVE